MLNFNNTIEIIITQKLKIDNNTSSSKNLKGMVYNTLVRLVNKEIWSKLGWTDTNQWKIYNYILDVECLNS